MPTTGNPNRSDGCWQPEEFTDTAVESIATLWTEYDRAVQILMDTVDLVDAVQRNGHHVDIPKLRKRIAATMRESIAARDEALEAVGVSVDEDGTAER